MLPTARTTETDGGLGIRSPLTRLPMVVMGQCTAGDFNVPTPVTRKSDLVATFGAGRAVEAAAYAIERFGLTVIVIRTETDTAHVLSAVTSTALGGTSVVTLEDQAPNDDYEPGLRVILGGTIGTGPITLQYTLDNGRTWSADVSLGTAVNYTIPGSNVRFNFAAGTLVTGATYFADVFAENFDGTNLGDACDALASTALAWEFVQVCGPVTDTLAGVVDAMLDSLHALGKHHWALMHFEVQDKADSDATYIAAFNTEFSAYAHTSVAMAAGACKCASNVTRGRQYRRPPSHPVGALIASLSEEIDAAQILQAGRLPGVTLRDSLGNPEAGYYDESVSPGLDDVRALTLRTHDGEAGVFVNNPRLCSPTGSDFDFVQKRRVMNLARGAAVQYLRRQVLSRNLRVNTQTSYIREADLQSLESGANMQVRGVVMAKPKASSATVVLHRNDPVLQPPYPLTGDLRLVPLAYPKDVTLDASYALTEPITVQGA